MQPTHTHTPPEPGKILEELQRPRALSIDQFVARYHVCRTLVYQLFGRGELRPRKVGSKTLIDFNEAENWWNNLPLADLTKQEKP